MARAISRSTLRALLVAGLTLPSVALAAGEPRVVVALDSSRSLSAAQSGAAAALARDLAVRLSATSSPGVLTFDDTVHWLAKPGEGGAEAALEALRPSGRFTVLNDGLVEGVRALDEGGVLVVISDGKDENSATTLEDVARLASEQDVRIVTLGAGAVDERTMRRLALLTRGLYAGVANGADPDALTAEVEALRRQVAAEAAPAPAAPPPAAAAAPAPAAPAPAPAPPKDNSRLLLLLGALVAGIGIVVGFLLARRRAPAEAEPAEEPEAGTKPGVIYPDIAAPAAPAAAPAPSSTATEPAPEPVDAARLARIRTRPAVPPGGLMEISLDDTAAFQRLPFSESIERTLVLTEEVVLTVREPGRDPRTYRIPPGRAFDVGRDAKRNALAFQDPTMSVQHFRLALEEGEIFLVDLGSTNGVTFKERRVASAHLYPGDKFRAGMIEFDINLHRASVS